MSTILAKLLMTSGALAIASIAQSRQTVPPATLSLDVITFVIHVSAPSATDGSNDVNHYYNFICRLFENEVLDPHSVCTFADYFRTPALRNISFSAWQLGDLNGGVALNFRNTVILASEHIALNSLTYAHTRAIGFEIKINFRGMTFFIDYCLTYRSARNK
jgi:hypothetical protein